MKVINRVPFEYDGRDYEVWVSLEESGYQVRAYLDGRPANGFSYFVNTQVQHDAIASRSFVRPLEGLIEVAKADVLGGVWEQYIKSASDARWTGGDWT